MIEAPFVGPVSITGHSRMTTLIQPLSPSRRKFDRSLANTPLDNSAAITREVFVISSSAYAGEVEGEGAG